MLVPAAGIVGCKMIVNEHKLRYVLGVRTYARMYVRTYVCAHARTYVHTRAHALPKTGMDIIKVKA